MFHINGVILQAGIKIFYKTETLCHCKETGPAFSLPRLKIILFLFKLINGFHHFSAPGAQ